MGKKKAIVSDKKDAMHSPIQFADDLFIESCFATDNLLSALRKILDLVGYDYSGITIAVQAK
jgi:hypothetical protein